MLSSRVLPCLVQGYERAPRVSQLPIIIWTYSANPCCSISCSILPSFSDLLGDTNRHLNMKSAEWSDNQDLQWVGYIEVQADGLEPDEDEI